MHATGAERPLGAHVPGSTPTRLHIDGQAPGARSVSADGIEASELRFARLSTECEVRARPMAFPARICAAAPPTCAALVQMWQG